MASGQPVAPKPTKLKTRVKPGRTSWSLRLLTDPRISTKPLDGALRSEYVRAINHDYVDIPLPTEKGRRELFKINLRGIELEEGIDWEHLVKMTDGYSGADISNVCREAAMMPMRRKLLSSQFDINNIHSMQQEIEVPLSMTDFQEAIKNIQKSVS